MGKQQINNNTFVLCLSLSLPFIVQYLSSGVCVWRRDSMISHQTIIHLKTGNIKQTNGFMNRAKFLLLFIFFFFVKLESVIGLRCSLINDGTLLICV